MPEKCANEQRDDHGFEVCIDRDCICFKWPCPFIDHQNICKYYRKENENETR